MSGLRYQTNRLIEYRYDAAGNRIQTIDSGVATDYITNNLNQYDSVGDATFDYDLDGNLISRTENGQTWTYGYDSENRLISVTSPDDSWVYEYNALGERVATVHNGDRTEYLLDPTGITNIVGEYSGDGSLIAQLHSFL